MCALLSSSYNGNKIKSKKVVGTQPVNDSNAKKVDKMIGAKHPMSCSVRIAISNTTSTVDWAHPLKQPHLSLPGIKQQNFNHTQYTTDRVKIKASNQKRTSSGQNRRENQKISNVAQRQKWTDPDIEISNGSTPAVPAQTVSARGDREIEREIRWDIDGDAAAQRVSGWVSYWSSFLSASALPFASALSVGFDSFSGALFSSAG